MASKKKGGFFGHARRVGDRVGRRARQFVNDARGGTYDQARLAQDVGSAIIDTVDLFGGLFGGGASPSVGLANIGPAAAAAYMTPNGVSKTVLLDDSVPDDAVWPIVGAVSVLQLALLNTPATLVDLRLLRVEPVDAENVELRVTIRTTGGAAVAAGEYYGALYYESASQGPGQYFTATIRAVVT